MAKFQGVPVGRKPAAQDKIIEAIASISKTLTDLVSKRDAQIVALLESIDSKEIPKPDNTAVVSAIDASNDQIRALVDKIPQDGPNIEAIVESMSAKTPVSITNVEQPKADRWEFEVQRGSDSYISKVIATPIFNNPTRH